jgi:hypothetical protein
MTRKMPRQKPGRSQQVVGTPPELMEAVVGLYGPMVWFAQHVHDKALIVALRPRLTFVGHATPFPKDIILAIFGEQPGFDTWRWQPTKARGARKASTRASR